MGSLIIAEHKYPILFNRTAEKKAILVHKRQMSELRYAGTRRQSNDVG